LQIFTISGTSDPFVRVWLAEEPKNSQQTKIFSRNLNPKFQQVLSLSGKSINLVRITNPPDTLEQTNKNKKSNNQQMPTTKHKLTYNRISSSNSHQGSSRIIE
jgi:hypothetical protein